MERMSLRGEERGVSVVVGVILLLAIAVVVVPVVYNHYIRTSMTSNESSHMNEVRKQFLELQSKVSWMKNDDSGTVRFPMNAESVSFSPGQSPFGALSISPGRGIKSLGENWENVVIKYHSIQASASGSGPPKSAENNWSESIDNVRSKIVVSGTFRKDLSWQLCDDDYSGSENASVENASVEVMVHDTEGGWVTLFRDISRLQGDTGWSDFRASYVPEGKVDNVVVSMELEVSGGQDGDYYFGWWGGMIVERNDLSARGELWVDNVKARWAPLPENANYKIRLNPGSIRFSGHNIYYPDQTYVFEGGHLILSQNGTETMLESNPSMISWERMNENRYRVKVEYPLISGENSFVSSSGSGSVHLTRRGDIHRSGLTENFTLVVETDYENAWLEYFEGEVSEMPSGLAKAGINDNGNPYLNVASGDNIIIYSITAENIETSL